MNRITSAFQILLLLFLTIGVCRAQCEIWDVTVAPSDCDGGFFFVALDFNFDEVGSEGFTVQGNGTNYGNFEYADLPVQIGPLEGDGTTEYEFVAIDNQHNDCQDWTAIDPVFCGVGDCEVYDLVLTPSACDADNTYDLTIDFQYQDPSNDFFDVVYDGAIIGFYALADLPITLENFNDNGEASPNLTVCINDNANCCASGEFLAPNCTNSCHLFDLHVTDVECDGAVFYITLGFGFDNVGNDGFNVHGNGTDYGDFSYNDVPFTLGPLPVDGTFYEFVVSDVQYPDCSDFVEHGEVDCGGGDCQITDLVVETGDCHSDGTYDIWIDFNYQNPTSDFFDVTYNGLTIATFPLVDLPVQIEHFEDDGDPLQGLLVCINDTPNCCEDVGFEAPNCGDCHIFDLHVTDLECDGAVFYITLDFGYDNVGNDGFNVHGNGTDYGDFSYNDVPFTLGPLTVDGTFYEFVVSDVQHPDCADFVDYGIVDCSGGSDCNIYDLTFETGDCNTNNTYNLWIDFDHENATNDFFDVIYNGTNIGFFELADLPILIENFEDDGEISPEITICINDNPNCCETGGFLSPCNNGGDCEIWDIFAEAHDCNSDGQFMVDIEFNSNNTGSEGFFIQANGVDYGPFDYGEVFYTFGPLEGGVVYEILILDNEHPNCHGFHLFGPVFCDDNCHIYDLHALVSDCDANDQFYVTLDFEHSGTGNDGFKVVGNGNVYGFFGYDDLPITLGPFSTPSADLEFIVTDVQQPDCGDFVEVDAPNCGGGGDCEIYDLTADVTPCQSDGTFYVVLDFEYENTSEIAFSVHGNGINYGLFGYDELPISIGPLVGNGTTPYEFAVNDLLQPDCGAAIGIGPVECDIIGDCVITDFVADASDCNNDGTYDLWLNFDYEFSTNIFFEVIYEGEIVDYFPLANLPVILPHFHDNGAGLEQEITVCINDMPDCCATYTYTAPDCNGPNLVWPGDTEANNQSNHFDLLNIGLAFGFEGPARDVQGIEWTPLLAEQWPQQFTDELNFVYADCDGNGVINGADIQAIEVNFGESHDEVLPPVLIGGTEDDPPFYVDLPGAGAIVDGEQFSASIVLGTEVAPVDNLYGIAFTLNFDPLMIDPATVQLQYDPSWLGVENVNLITFDRTAANDGTVQVALVRTDQSDVSGHGHVAEFIGIIDNIAGKEEVRIEISNVKAITEKEVLIALHRPVKVAGLTTGTTEPRQGIFEVYPNPAKSEVYLYHPKGLNIISVEVKSVNGQTLMASSSGNSSLSVSNLPSGIYFLKIETEEGVFIEKLVKM